MSTGLPGVTHSGFCSFRPSKTQDSRRKTKRFQSLVRDSAHSDLRGERSGTGSRKVSIPRSGFCSFRRDNINRFDKGGPGFNPSFGILLIQTAAAALRTIGAIRFNPSFGILLIQTFYFLLNTSLYMMFQSLVRDSAHSDKIAQ